MNTRDEPRQLALLPRGAGGPSSLKATAVSGAGGRNNGRIRSVERARAALRAREKSNLWVRLEADARRIAERFGLSYTSMEPEREGVKRHYGITYSDGTIRIRLRHSRTGRPLKYSSLVNTVCHELAHLRHFNHGEGFKRFYFRLLAWSREQGIYRPSTEEPRPAEQLGLFRTVVPDRSAVATGSYFTRSR